MLVENLIISSIFIMRLSLATEPIVAPRCNPASSNLKLVDTKTVEVNMQEKKCSRCGVVKSVSEFNKDKKTKDKLNPWCKDCSNIYKKAYYHSELGLINRMYGHQISSSKHRNMLLPNYTKNEFKNWLYANNFKQLYDNWVKSDYTKNSVPSCDRLNDYNPYTLNNIRLVTWQINDAKGRSDRKNGINNKHSKAVEQYKDGVVINEFCSASEAGRKTGLNFRNICTCCRGKSKSVGGYQWRYLND